MAWRRDEARLNSSSFTAYAYTEAEMEVGATECTYRHLGGITSPYYFAATADSDLWWEESGSRYDYASGSATFNGYGDLKLCDEYGYFTRQASDRTVYLGVTTSMMGASADAWLTYIIPHLPNAPASITATRVSDNQVTVSWTAPARSYDAMCLEVSIDGGSWSEFTQLWNASTSTTYSQASADHSYRFRARAYYQSAYSDYTSPTAAVAMTPSAPQSISVAASGGTNVAVTLTNNSPVATSLEYQTSTDGGSTWSASTTVSGSPVTSFSTSVSGTALIRVRNKNATGVSDWLVSDPITTICPPAPPTLRTPSGSVYDMAQGDIEFSWLHNSLDGSAQTAYQLRYAINGGAWTTLPGTTSQSRTVSIGTFSVGNAVTWQVKTKGADANYSDWSQTGAFSVYTAPTLSITSPGATITGMPISLAATYSDMAGFTCQAATVSLTKDGRTLYSEAATISGTSITASLDVSEFLPTNGESYTIVMTARSSSGLQTSANATFTVDFTEPQAGELSIVNDPETGYASLLATFDNHASDVEYSGETNAQYESTEGYVRSLTVEGKSERVASRNLLDVFNEFPKANTTYSGCTITNNGDGTFGLSGTNTSSSTWGFNSTSGSMILPAGTYTLSSGGGMTGCYMMFKIGSTNYTVGANQPDPRVITLSEAATLTQWSVMVREFATISGTCKPMIESGGEHGAYEPYFDPYLQSIEGAGVVGRNLVPSESGWEQGMLNEGAPVGSSYSTLKLNRPNRIMTTDLVPVEPSTTYTVKLNTNYQLFYCCFGSGGYLGVYNGWLTNNTGTFTFTTNANTTAVGLCICHLDSSDITPSEVPTMNMSMFKTLTTITTSLRGLPQGKGDELQVDGTEVSKFDRTYYDTISAVGTVNTSGSTWYAAITTTNQATLRRDWTSYDDYSADRGTTGTEYAYCTQTTKISATGKGIFVARTWNGLYAYCTAADAQELGITTSDFAALVGAGVIARNKTATDALPDISPIEIGSTFTVSTDLDTTFDMVAWDGSADAVSISVARVNADGSITPLLTDGQTGAGIVDRYAPLNTEYQYAMTTKASSQAVKTVYVDNMIESDYWFAYWGENVAKAKWNPDNGGIQVTRPQKTRVYYAGRKDPVSYDGHAVALTETPSWMFIGKSEVDAFVKLIEDGGRGIYKSCDGWVYHADFDLTLTPAYTAIGYYGTASLGITRIAGERL